MAVPHTGGNGIPEMEREEHQHNLLAKRVVILDGLGNQLVSFGISEGGQTAEVNTRTDGIVALEVNDDFTSFEANHQVLVSSTDTTVTFAQAVRMIQVSNWDTANRILVKDGSITSDSDSTAARVGKAPAADIPGKSTFVFKTASIHLRSAVNSEVTVTAYF